MPSYFPFDRIQSLSLPVKILSVLGLGALAVVAWPVMVATVFVIIVLSTLQSKRVGYVMAAAMIVPALLMEGVWANSMVAGMLNGGQPKTADNSSPSNVAVADFQQQVRGSQDKKNAPKVKVVTAVSGDTVEVEIDGRPDRIHLIGIDAPDVIEVGTSECFATESQMFLDSLLKDRTVEVITDEDLGDKDENGNLWRYLRMTDANKVNELMLEAGLAREDSAQAYEQQDIYIELAASAQQNNKGLWATCNADGLPNVTPPPTSDQTESDVSTGGEASTGDFVQPTPIPTVDPNSN